MVKIADSGKELNVAALRRKRETLKIRSRVLIWAVGGGSRMDALIGKERQKEEEEVGRVLENEGRRYRMGRVEVRKGMEFEIHIRDTVNRRG